MRQAPQPYIIEIPSHIDERGSLHVAEEGCDIPFHINRAFWISGISQDATRGGHAHIREWQMIVAVTGIFTVVTDNGSVREAHILDSPSRGLVIPAGNWCELSGFSSEAVCLVFSSMPFDPGDYIRDYNTFVNRCRDSQ